MNTRYLYLTIDLAVVAIPLAASFYPRAPFYRQWKPVGIGLIATALFFIAWDELFTRLGIWSFNERYITGVYVGSLPIEEVLFFICIPYACMFTYFALSHLVRNDVLYHHQKVIGTTLASLLMVTGAALYYKLYTVTTFVLLALFLILQSVMTRSDYMGRFYVAWLILLIPFFIVNGILTGAFTEEPVVIYNAAHNLGVRIGTIPIEDAFYGMMMMGMAVAVAERVGMSNAAKNQLQSTAESNRKM
ncbi:MAG: lycopene cyclase domain-containing protein [Chryseolinea sp.]